VSDYDKSLHRHDKKQKMESRKAASEEVRLQTTARNRQRGCKRDVRRQTVPNTCGSDRKARSPMVDNRVRRITTVNRWWWWGWPQTTSSLKVCQWPHPPKK